MLGPDHPDTLASRSNLATPTRAGRAAEAIALHEQTLAASGSGCWARTTPTP